MDRNRCLASLCVYVVFLVFLSMTIISAILANQAPVKNMCNITFWAWPKEIHEFKQLVDITYIIYREKPTDYQNITTPAIIKEFKITSSQLVQVWQNCNEIDPTDYYLDNFQSNHISNWDVAMIFFVQGTIYSGIVVIIYSCLYCKNNLN